MQTLRLFAGFAAISISAAGSIAAQAPKSVSQPAPAAAATQDAVAPIAHPEAHQLDAADVQAFFDGILPMQMERADIAGASVLVMKEGQVLLQKGYGYGNAKEKRPVDPASTIFRLASISKLFTWVSVMQLQEQGKLDLDTDVNAYLDFQIRPAFGKPVTLRNLMTHTGGFEESVMDIILIKPATAVPLREFLIRNQPKRMFAPGTVPAYSNYGVGLASYIVQRISGEPFEQYVNKHVFAPLGMNHSSFFQPLPKELETLPSEGYRANSEKDPVGFEILNPGGAGGLSSTAVDMGRFGSALLNGGELDGKRVLKPETLAQMLTPQFRASEQMPPICMGFYETWRNDLRWIGHEGDLIAFHSLFFIERTHKLLLFVSYNSSSSAPKTRQELVQMFTDRYFPSGQKQAFVTRPLAEIKDVEGVYVSTRRADSTKLSAMSLTEQRTAHVDKDGVLSIEEVNDLRGHNIKWKPLGKDFYQQVDGQRRLFAIRDESRKVIRLAGDFPGVQSQRVRWHENGKRVLAAFGSSLLILALAVAAPLVRVIRRLFLKNRPRLEPQPGTSWLPIPTKLSAGLWLVLYGGILAFVAAAGDDLPPPTAAWVKYFYLANFMTAAAIVCSLWPIGSALVAWLRSDIRTITKTKYTMVALACLFLVWFSIHWNIIGPASRI
jgi:CubicO group peptidase (beta-lactamase class C family)